MSDSASNASPVKATPIRVALISDGVTPRTGYGTFTCTLADGLAARNDIDPCVLVPKESPIPNNFGLASATQAVLPSPWTSFRSRPDKFLQFFRTGFPIDGVDLIHTVVEFPYAITAWRLANRLRVPFVVSVHGTFAVIPFSRFPVNTIYRAAMRNASAITAPSNFTADAFRQASGLRKEVGIVGNPVDTSRFQNPTDTNKTRQSIGLPENSRVILSVGVIKSRKGFDLLIRAFGKISSEEPNVHLVIAGTLLTGSPENLLSLARSLGIQDNVHILLDVDDESLVALYQMCDVFALLPREFMGHFEGFGIVYLEAGACGKPVVGTRSGGVQDAVREGETGLLVDEDDHESAAAAILSLLRDPKLAKSMGEAGKKWAGKHKISSFSDTITSIYSEALNRYRLRTDRERKKSV